MDEVFYGMMTNGTGNMTSSICSDPSLCYDIVIDKDEAEDESKVEYLDVDRVDYGSLYPSLKDTYLEERGVPLSFLSVRNEDEGMEWYSKHTQMPDYMIPYLASYHWGDLSKPTKKTKYKKKKKKTPPKFEVKQGKFLVEF